MATIEVLTRSELESKVLEVPGPVALDFYQASCAPCRALEPRLERITGSTPVACLCIVWISTAI